MSTKRTDLSTLIGKVGTGSGSGSASTPSVPAPAREVEIREVEVIKEVHVDSLPSLDDVPARSQPDHEGQDLSDEEQADLESCEAAITAAQEGARRAFWVVGKALQVVQDGRLYRARYAKFSDYTLARWDMTARQAYRLIEAWQLADLVRPIGHTPPTESQIRELLPAVKEHGDEAAVRIWTEVQEKEKVTAAAVAEVRDRLFAPQARPAEAEGPDVQAAVASRMSALQRALGRKVSRAELSRHLMEVLTEDDRLFDALLARLRTVESADA